MKLYYQSNQETHATDEDDRDRKIAALQEENRRLKLKREQKARNTKPHILNHPREDRVFARLREPSGRRGEDGLFAILLRHGGRRVLQAYMDPGPARPGWVQTPSLTFEADARREAERLGMEIPEVFIQEACLAIEKRVEDRFRTTEDRVRRAVNSMVFAVWESLGGPEPRWLGLHYPPEGTDSALGLRLATDTTDAASGTPGPQPSETNEDEEEDAPQEYYSPGFYDQDEVDASPDEDADEDTVVENDDLLDDEEEAIVDDDDDLEDNEEEDDEE